MAFTLAPDPRLDMPESLYPTRTPTGNVKINIEHPLARNNVLFGFGDKLLGKSFVDRGLGHDGSPYGWGVDADGSSNNRITVDDDLIQSSEFTWWCLIYRHSDSANVARPFGRTARNGSAVPYLNYDFEMNSSGQQNIDFGINTTAGLKTLKWTTAPTRGLVSLCGIVRDNITHAYGNGKYIGQITTTGVSNYATDSDIYIGGYAPTGYQNTGAIILAYGVWQRGLLGSETGELHRDPYKFLTPNRD